ncbi:MAG: terminase [Rhodobacteraceae bacterium]|nr:terminase [Paracoccaceae bacterium]MAY44653.1 terminase [Paracoccaceae bacterium]
MGFLAPAEAIVASALAQAMRPPPPPDLTRWCEENVVFPEGSPVPGPFDIDRFPFLREIHEVLSPEHPSREVTVMGSAQIGKTVSIIHPTLGAWHEYTALDSLVVHPTDQAAKEWKTTKWLRMCRTAPSLRRIFGTGSANETITDQETLDRNGTLKTVSAGSPASLTGTSRRLVIMDDVAKYDMTDKGDPEPLAESRASGFEDAKILRVSTPLIKGTCRISRAFARSDQRYFEVPCPHCGHFQALTWENFLASIDPERLHAAHFTCERCQEAIRQSHRERIVRAGQWKARNPRGDHPGFFFWRVYAPMRDWASVAQQYAIMMGWTRLVANTSADAAKKDDVETETEQVFWNDVLGLPFEQASDAPDWEALRDRTEHAKEDDEEIGVLPVGVVPVGGFLLAAGVDCQEEHMEMHVCAFGRNRQRWTIDYVVIPHHVGSEDGRAALSAQLKRTWKTALGLPLQLDALAIDGGTWTDDVWSWARTHPMARVIVVKGASTQNGPIMMPMKFERRKDGKRKKRDKRGFMLNVSQMKGNYYNWLKVEDPAARGFCRFARGLGDEFYRQITSEVKILSRTRTGVMVARWDLAEPSRRNEGLDTALYAEAAARRKGWASMTDDEWDRLEEARSARPADQQGDLFDAPAARVAEVDETKGAEAENRPVRKTKSLSGILNGI